MKKGERVKVPNKHLSVQSGIETLEKGLKYVKR